MDNQGQKEREKETSDALHNLRRTREMSLRSATETSNSYNESTGNGNTESVIPKIPATMASSLSTPSDNRRYPQRDQKLVQKLAIPGFSKRKSAPAAVPPSLPSKSSKKTPPNPRNEKKEKNALALSPPKSTKMLAHQDAIRLAYQRSQIKLMQSLTNAVNINPNNSPGATKGIDSEVDSHGSCTDPPSTLGTGGAKGQHQQPLGVSTIPMASLPTSRGIIVEDLGTDEEDSSLVRMERRESVLESQLGPPITATVQSKEHEQQLSDNTLGDGVSGDRISGDGISASVQQLVPGTSNLELATLWQTFLAANLNKVTDNSLIMSSPLVIKTGIPAHPLENNHAISTGRTHQSQTPSAIITERNSHPRMCRPTRSSLFQNHLPESQQPAKIEATLSKRYYKRLKTCEDNGRKIMKSLEYLTTSGYDKKSFSMPTSMMPPTPPPSPMPSMIPDVSPYQGWGFYNVDSLAFPHQPQHGMAEYPYTFVQPQPITMHPSVARNLRQHYGPPLLMQQIHHQPQQTSFPQQQRYVQQGQVPHFYTQQSQVSQTAHQPEAAQAQGGGTHFLSGTQQSIFSGVPAQTHAPQYIPGPNFIQQAPIAPQVLQPGQQFADTPRYITGFQQSHTSIPNFQYYPQ